MQPHQTQPDELQSFRSEWINEVHQRYTHISAATPQTSTSTNPPLPKQFIASSSSATVLDIYASAVHYERMGLLDQALIHYRKAFRLEPEIDLIYQNLNLDDPVVLLDSEHGGNPSQNHAASAASSSLQNINHQLLDTHDLSSLPDLTANLRVNKKSDPSNHHSTRLFLRSLIDSFLAHPWQRNQNHPEILGEEHHPEPIACMREIERKQEEIDSKLNALKIEADLNSNLSNKFSISYVSVGLRFEPLDLNQKCILGRIPIELVNKILCIHNLKRNEIHLGINNMEIFGRVCRFARILTLEKSIWRSICLTIYSNDLFTNQKVKLDISSSDSHLFKFKFDFVYSLCLNSYDLDWRRMFIHQPRIRLDGCYISLVRYPRLGESANPWYTPTHFVTYFRYLRFFENGTCISLTSVEEPSSVVRKLNWPKDLKKTQINQQDSTSSNETNIPDGSLFGLWSLENNHLKIFKLHQDVNFAALHSSHSSDPHSNPTNHFHFGSTSTVPSRNNYQFLMDCYLSSTRPGKMNKIEVKRLATINLRSGEILEVPLSNPNHETSTKPKHFIFSRVISYDNHS